MILGVGIDLVHIPRMKRLIIIWGDKFKQRAFTDREISYSESHRNREERFAANFAVKEAFAKALGRGFGEELRFRDIEVLRDNLGKPYIRLYGNVESEFASRQINGIHTSISHDGEYAAGFVVIEKI